MSDVMNYNGRLIVWDIGGPLRDSSDSMGYALKTAASEKNCILNLDNKLLWQLWTIKGPKFNRVGGDYEAWFKAALAIENAALENGISTDDMCRRLFSSEYPTSAVAEIMERYGVGEDVHRPIGEHAIFLFGNDPETKSKSRVNGGSVEAVKSLYVDGNLMGIVTSAPNLDSATGWTNLAIHKPLVENGEIPTESVIFNPELVFYGSISKEKQLESSVINAEKILEGRRVSPWYVADTNDDIIETWKANEKLFDQEKPHIRIAMVKNGMGFPNMWKKALEETGFDRDYNYFEFGNSLDFANFIKEKVI